MQLLENQLLKYGFVQKKQTQSTPRGVSCNEQIQTRWKTAQQQQQQQQLGSRELLSLLRRVYHGQPISEFHSLFYSGRYSENKVLCSSFPVSCLLCGSVFDMCPAEPCGLVYPKPISPSCSHEKGTEGCRCSPSPTALRVKRAACGELLMQCQHRHVNSLCVMV